ncbi:hypothetical protein EPUS_08839 [Endocarpon pusillum Z07020]|uniref:protein-ribulosamine 3-kinase n=1 Tax=Endocarpon pusillum (strain Z07020 / HMAS-L-300199) TaxID=1263415 RepID=U1HW94_ENDPU|nr:uncharacterized protein EPUS_08839 [Endocarpon pusillum Z07020]ERF75025.1 hypothetical protein EPUS_08839 [Endocarpon pusillum Z07020]
MAEAEELRQLTLAAMAKLSLGSTQSDDIDENVLAALPPGTEFVSIAPHGVSSFNETWRIETTLDGVEKLYFMKSHKGDLGRRSLQGSFESEKLFCEYEPEHVPRPIAFGNYKSDPDTWFFLAAFHDMVEELPEVDKLVSIVADYHRKSFAKSPGGKWGFHMETGLPFKMIDEEEIVHGQADELDELKKDLFEKVMPRLLRPMETGGRSIKPCLIHTDLWPGNILPDVDTDRLMLYDSRAMWGHNECDLGTWRAARFRLGTPYVTEYQRKMSMSEPQEDWSDRHALYALRYKILNAVLFPGEERLRRVFMDEMRRLIQKYPNGLDDFQEESDMKVRKSATAIVPRQAALQESTGNVQ